MRGIGWFPHDVSMTSPRDQLTDLLATHRTRLTGFVIKEAKGLLRHESEEDLVQGIHIHALSVADHFEYRSEKEFIAWLFTVARQQLINRQRYWSAARRDGGNLLRVTVAGAASTNPRGVDPKASMTGPGTLADRREQLELATRVVALLSERDRNLIHWMSEDVPLEEAAKRLDLTYEAAKRARLRAIDRFRATFELLSNQQPPEKDQP